MALELDDCLSSCWLKIPCPLCLWLLSSSPLPFLSVSFHVIFTFLPELGARVVLSAEVKKNEKMWGLSVFCKNTGRLRRFLCPSLLCFCFYTSSLCTLSCPLSAATLQFDLSNFSRKSNLKSEAKSSHSTQSQRTVYIDLHSAVSSSSSKQLWNTCQSNAFRWAAIRLGCDPSRSPHRHHHHQHFHSHLRPQSNEP